MDDSGPQAANLQYLHNFIFVTPPTPNSPFPDFFHIKFYLKYFFIEKDFVI